MRRSRRDREAIMIRVSAFRWVPPFARGLVRDLRVRWALEEACLPYEERLIGPEDQASDSYRRLQPFGQVPAYEEDGLVLFESGAIVLHVAERSETLMPCDPKRRARVTAWMFAALNTMEPRIQNLAEIDLFHAEEEWAKLRRPGRGRGGKSAAREPGRLARRAGLSRGSLHRRGPAHDDGAAHPAPHGSGRADASARGLPPAVRGTARFPEGPRRPNGRVHAQPLTAEERAMPNPVMRDGRRERRCGFRGHVDLGLLRSTNS